MYKKLRALYGINATGQGHISRAKALLPYLRQFATVDVLLSGKRYEFEFGEPVKYFFKGATFSYKNGSIDWARTLLNIRIFDFFRDIFKLNLNSYDLIISDFEPISAWAARFQGKFCIQVSHQASFFSYKAPRPIFWPLWLFGELFLKYFAYSPNYIGIHFKCYSSCIIGPILHDDIITAKPRMRSHVTVYLSSFSLDQQLTFFKKFADQNFELYHADFTESTLIQNITIHPLSESFKHSLISCKGYITNAGFESCAEALYLQKPLLSIPIRYQYEQYCNAAALKKLGVTVLSKLNHDHVSHWLDSLSIPKKIKASSTNALATMIKERYFTQIP